MLSQPEGIICSTNSDACNFQFEEQEIVTLTATAEPGYVFAGWQGDCSGQKEACKLVYEDGLDVVARFVEAGGDVKTPSRPAGVLNAVDKDELSIGWHASIDDLTPPEQLIYKVYLSDSEENLLQEANLVEQVVGSEELFVTIQGVQPNFTYYAAVVAVDQSLNQSQATTSSTTTPIETPSLRDDVVTYAADEQGWGAPTFSEETGLYTFNFSATLLSPEVGSFIAIPAEDIIDAHDLSKVRSIESNGTTTTVTARPALLFEISDDLTISGSTEITTREAIQLKLTEEEAKAIPKKKGIQNPARLEKYESEGNENNSLTTDGSLASAERDISTPSALVPNPTDDCNSQPTTELDFDGYATPDFKLEFGFGAAGMGICSDTLKDDLVARA